MCPGLFKSMAHSFAGSLSLATWRNHTTKVECQRRQPRVSKLIFVLHLFAFSRLFRLLGLFPPAVPHMCHMSLLPCFFSGPDCRSAVERSPKLPLLPQVQDRPYGCLIGEPADRARLRLPIPKLSRIGLEVLQVHVRLMPP